MATDICFSSEMETVQIVNLSTIKTPGYYYQKDGTFLEKKGSSQDVYVDGDLLYTGIKKVLNEDLLRMAGLAYGESGYSDDVIKSIPFCITNRHNIYINSGLEKSYPKDTWTLNKTLIKMRNNWSDKVYAHEHHFGAIGNGAFRAFLNINVNEEINYDKNALGRNGKKQMILAIEYTIKAIQYFDNNCQGFDVSNGSTGWQGADILNNKNWKNWLYIHSEHLKFAFKNWKNTYTLDKSICESTGVYKGKFGTTILWKPSAYAFKLSPRTGKL